MNHRPHYRYMLISALSLISFFIWSPAMAVQITEIMYHPVEEGGTSDGEELLEFIELYNNQAVSEDISGYTFTKGISFEFAPNTILGAKEYLVVARYPDAVKAAYGIDTVAGPFTGKLDNSGEQITLTNAGGEIILSFNYKDTHPWPISPDGTGHSLFLARPGLDPADASAWSPSTLIGGTPGGPDQSQMSHDPTLVTLVDIGTSGYYFKGIKEPSPDLNGNPLTVWSNIDFNPAAPEWATGANGYGYSNSQDELQYISTPLNDMNGNYWSVYARIPFILTQEQINAFTQLHAVMHYDDGFVLYLNGTRVAASSYLTATPPPYDSPGASTGWDPLEENIDLASRLGLLVPGVNILSFQVHNSSLMGSSDCFGAVELRAVMATGPEIHARVVINELLTNSHTAGEPDWLELYNPGPIPVDLSHAYLSDKRLDLLYYKIPNGTILQPGQFWSVTQGTAPDGFPFGLSTAGETVFLTMATNDTMPNPIRVLDAVQFGPLSPDSTFGRYPDGSDNIEALSSPTFGTANARPFYNDIVINEIMYHHGSDDARYEYIELYNKGTSTVSLTGWRFTDGIDYVFPEGASIDSGKYLVLAADPGLLAATYNHLTTGSNLIGPYAGKLDNHSERIRLAYPIDYVDPDTGKTSVLMVTADEITYYDGGRWPTWADGQGSSMELIDPESNNNAPDAWADSDESHKAPWEQFSFTINSNDPQYTHDSVSVFDLIMLNRGEVLLDNVELLINGTNRLANTGFENGMTGWRYLGNHVQSFATTEDKVSGTRCLHVVSTGHGDPGANRINQTFSTVTGGTVTFRGWARWLKGTQFMLLRTSQENAPVQPPRPAHSFQLNMPMNLGTPGQQNSRYLSNRGPDILHVSHKPALPMDGEPIIVTAVITDNNGVDSVTLYYRSEGESFTTVSMRDNGTGGDAIAGDSIYTGTIPGAAANTMRAFYISASDGSATTRFPARLPASAQVPDRTCLVRVGDAVVNSQFAKYRIWMSNDVVNIFLSRPNLSNELMDCTFVYDDTEVFYNAKIRFRGSPFIRSGFGRNPADRYAFRLDFNPDRKFRGKEEINLDNTEGGDRGPLQERASYWFYRKMGLQYSTQEYIRPIINGNAHTVYEDVQKIDGDYIDAWFPNDNDGYIHKIDDYFEYTADGTGFSNYDEGLKYDANHPLLKETYRWGFEKRSNRENDTWDHLFNFAVAMNTSLQDGPAYETAIESMIHPEHFARVLAIRHALGDWDSYGYTRGKNNYYYYAFPENKWYLLPWDIDFTLGSGHGPTTNLFLVNADQFPEVNNFLNYPKYRRMYLQAFAELIGGPWQTSYGTANPPTEFDRYLDENANALVADGAGDGRRDAIKEFVRNRQTYIASQLPSLTFMITSNNGDDFCTSESTVSITGVAPIQVAQIEVNGTIVPSTFSGTNAFSVDIPLVIGSNELHLKGLDNIGNAVPGATDSITVLRVEPIIVSSVFPPKLCNNSSTAEIRIYGTGFFPDSASRISLQNRSKEIGFNALYVQSSTSFDRIDAATVLLDNPSGGIGDEVYWVHDVINLFQTGSEGIFSPSAAFAPPFNTGDPGNFAVRFTGYIYAPFAGRRYFGVNSDDGFRLTIEGQLVGECPDPRAPATTDVTNVTSGTMWYDFPAEGNYYMVLDFFENGGGEEIEFFQTNSVGGDPRLINGDAELIVLRDDVIRINATNVVVENENTITCQVDVTGAATGLWNLEVTPECGTAAKAVLDEAVSIITPPAGSVNWNIWPDEPVITLMKKGGVLEPKEYTFVLSNTGTAALDWMISKDPTAEWLDIETFSGSLEAGANTEITVIVNEAAASLDIGLYNCDLTLSIAGGCSLSEAQRQIRLAVTYRSDFTFDFKVDSLDLSVMALMWLEGCSEPDWCNGVDLDKDGMIRIRDLSLLAEEWLVFGQ